MTVEYHDGKMIDSSGPLRVVHRGDGYYVVGNGLCCPVDSAADGEKVIEDIKRARVEGDKKSPPAKAIIIGTAHFVSFADAARYYSRQGISRDEVAHKMVTKEIRIGPPTLMLGQTMQLIDGGTRYAIVENSPDPLGPLIGEYNTWIKATGYPYWSADELAIEIGAAREGCSKHIAADFKTKQQFTDDIQWLTKFIERWEAAEK